MNSNHKPAFQSSFIQYWYADNWALERWEKELVMLRDIGISEIILASAADTKAKYAVYFSRIPEFTHGSFDMIDTALTAAAKLGMKVRIGIGFNDEWWKKSGNKAWLDNESSTNKLIIREIAESFGAYKAFSGWYIPHEFSQLNALTRKQQQNLNSFYKNVCTEIKNRLPKEIMIAPYYHGTLQWLTPLSNWSVMLENVLQGTFIDIVALQDSIGAKFGYLRQLPRILDCTKKVCHDLGMKFYVDVETFTSTPTGFVSAPQSRIEEQLSIGNEYAEGLVAFSIDHYQNKNEPSQARFYNDYYEYFMKT